MATGDLHSIDASKPPCGEISNSLSDESATKTPSGCAHIISHPDSMPYSQSGLLCNALTPPVLVAATMFPSEFASPIILSFSSAVLIITPSEP